MESLYYIVLVPMVYLALGVFAAGSAYQVARILKAPKTPASPPIFGLSAGRAKGWAAATADTFLMPSVRRHQPVLWLCLMVFHAALALLIIGHLELVADIPLLQVVPHSIFLGHGFVGLTAILALVYFLMRRFASPVRDLSVPEDYLLLILLFLVMLMGSQMDWARTWYDYSSLSVTDYRDYLWSLVTLKPEVPDTVMLTGHSFMLVLHVFFANLFLMALPFTKIMHSFLALPLNKMRRG